MPKTVNTTNKGDLADKIVIEARERAKRLAIPKEEFAAALLMGAFNAARGFKPSDESTLDMMIGTLNEARATLGRRH